MAEVDVSPNALSLLAEFDDLNRCNSILNDGRAEEYFIRFLEIQTQWQQQLSSAVTETSRLQKELQESLKKNSIWESKLSHARKLLDSERKQRIRAESEKNSLEKQMTLARDLLFNDNRSKLNNDTLEKLAFLNNTSTSRSTHVGIDPIVHGRLNTITELNSTGNLLSDQSFSRSEDDLDESIVNGRRSWKRHRPSGGPVHIPPSEEHSSAKKRCSSERSKGVVNNDEERQESQMSSCTQPTPKSTKVEYIMKTPSKMDTNSNYAKNIKHFAHPEQVRGKEAESWSAMVSGGACSPRGPARLRQHSFTNKTVIRPEPCTTCGNRIRFAKAVVKCTDCRAVCHIECKDKLPLPCVPSHGTPSASGPNQMGTIADYTPSVCPMVPALIIHCVNEVEARGLTEVGLYRVPGSEKEVKSLKERFLKNKGTPPLTNIDINVICGCIKDFLRSLREPLVTYSLWSDFVAATEMSDKNDSEASLYQAISELPQPNRDTLAFMMLHLQRVAECIECKMPAENLAKVFGPTIIGYSDNDPNPNEMYNQTRQQVAVMERLLEISSDYWARFAAVTSSDGSCVVATPPLHRTPSWRPRINTMPQLSSRMMTSGPVSKDTIVSTPSLTSSSKSSASNAKARGFFYTPVSGSNTATRNRKFYGTPDGI